MITTTKYKCLLDSGEGTVPDGGAVQYTIPAQDALP